MTLRVAIAAAGALATEDGGEPWQRRHRLANANAVAAHNHTTAPRDGGASWQNWRFGLPRQSCYLTVLRQAVMGDAQAPAGV